MSEPPPSLVADLRRRARWDRLVHRAVEAAVVADTSPTEASARSRRLRRDNGRWLLGVVDSEGWPGRTLVGRAAADDAWLLAQHADEEGDVQRRLLQALARAVADGEAAPWHLAYLTDRVLTRGGQPQRFGTHFRRGEDGSPQPFPLDDPAHLDRRRSALGLPPVAVFRQRSAHRLESLLAFADAFEPAASADRSTAAIDARRVTCPPGDHRTGDPT